MPPTRLARPSSPTFGALWGLRAGALAVLCVLLPLAGHGLSQGHTPRWIIVVGMVCVVVPAAVFLTRRRLSDAQLLAALAGAQLAYHLAYSLPGACTSIADPGGLAGLIEHAPAVGPPHEVLLTGHVITLLITARLLGITERLLWRSKPLLAAVRRLLLFIWPLLHSAHGPRSDLRARENAALPQSTLLAGLNAGRAPPSGRQGLPWPAMFSMTGPAPADGPCMP